MAGPAAPPPATQCLPSSTVNQLIYYCNATTNQYASDYQVAYNLTGEGLQLLYSISLCHDTTWGALQHMHAYTNLGFPLQSAPTRPLFALQWATGCTILCLLACEAHACTSKPLCMPAVFSPENANAPNVTENALNCCQRCTFTGNCNVWTWCNASGGCGNNVPAGYCTLGYTSQTTPYALQAGGPFVSGFFLRP